jgi:hypothetical protein
MQKTAEKTVNVILYLKYDAKKVRKIQYSIYPHTNCLKMWPRGDKYRGISDINKNVPALSVVPLLGGYIYTSAKRICYKIRFFKPVFQKIVKNFSVQNCQSCGGAPYLCGSDGSALTRYVIVHIRARTAGAETEAVLSCGSGASST